MPSKYGQVNLSPARPTSKSPGQREPHTPRTSFLHSFGTLGAPSPVPKFDEINGKLKSPAGANGGTGARSPAPRVRAAALCASCARACICLPAARGLRCSEGAGVALAR